MARNMGGIYIFTIIKVVTHPFLILTMALTDLPSLKIVRLRFATFARLARHGDVTRWRIVSRAQQNDLPAPGYLEEGKTGRASRSLAHFLVRATPTPDAFSSSPVNTVAACFFSVPFFSSSPAAATPAPLRLSPSHGRQLLLATDRRYVAPAAPFAPTFHGI